MTPAYNELYINQAMDTFAEMLDFAVYSLEIDADKFLELFLMSGIAYQFESGNPRYVVGNSGIELAFKVLDKVSDGYMISDKNIERNVCLTDAYWAGSVIAYYQWIRGFSFKKIFSYIKPVSILNMYEKYHEMDIRQAVDNLDRLLRIGAYASMTSLKIIRMKNNLSQHDLSERSGISVRTIQQYEQRQKDINKAAFSTIITLATALSCRPEDLVDM